MFNKFPQSDITIVGQDGRQSAKTKGLFSDRDIILADTSIVISPGDEIRRRIPNGTEETFQVLDAIFDEGLPPAIPAHMRVTFRRKGVYPAGAGGNYTIHVAGPNSRVNINSTDNSNNVSHQNEVFDGLIDAVNQANLKDSVKARLIEIIGEMKAATGNKRSFLSAYQKFMSTAADHVTIVAPFLPALAQMLT